MANKLVKIGHAVSRLFGSNFSTNEVEEIQAENNRIFTSTALINTDGFETSVQHPLPTDGDSVYYKDVWVDESIFTNWSGDITDLFDNLHSQVTNVTSDDPKTIVIHFNRTIVSNAIGLGNTGSGNFSNVLIKIRNSGGVDTTVIDDSADNTKYTTKTFQLPITAGFNALVIEFHTTDTISLSNCVILKAMSTVSRLQAKKPDNTITDINATAGGNLKTSLEELESGISSNSNTQLNTTQFNSSGIERDIDVNGITLSRDFLTQVKLGNVAGHRLIHKFGKAEVTTSPTPVAIGGVYQTPLSNQDLEFVSDDANDTIAGTGARKVIIQGLVLTGGAFVSQEEEVETNGLTAVPLVNQFIRVFRMWISETGTYATATAVSSAGILTVQGLGGGVKWIEIDEIVSGNSAGQSQTVLYTTPTACKSILFSPMFTVDASKSTNIYLFNRPNADVVTTPFTGARRMVHEWLGTSTGNQATDLMPISKFTGAVDIGFMASVSVGTADISAEFWLLEIEI